MSNVSYLKVGENKGTKRIWLQGQKLASQGIKPGMRYSLECDTDKICLVFSQDGKRLVSKKKVKDSLLPVMDVRADEIEEVFGDNVERVRVVIRSNEIIITLHHLEAAEHERLERLIKKLCNNEPLNTGSLAHGGGVLDLAIHTGLNMAGVDSRLSFAIEVERKYLDASLKNNPIWDGDSIAIESPMQDVEYKKLPKVEILNAGLPCTGASIAGRSKNKLSRAEEHETAGSLFITFINAIMTVQPAIFVLENVVPYQNTASMTVIRQVLSELGYVLHETILDGNEFGALEARKRLCVVGLTKGLRGFDINHIKPLRTKESSLNQILENISDDSPRWKKMDYLKTKEERDIRNGKGFVRQVLHGNESYCGCIGKAYSKLRSTEPMLENARTKLLRIFTPLEHSRAKTIPEYLVNGLSDTVAHEIMGQSVIYCAFQAVGKSIGKFVTEYSKQKIVV